MPRIRPDAPLVIAALALLAACGGASSPGPTSTGTAGSSDPLDLRGVCPSTVVVQTPWYPSAAEGPLYQLLGPNPDVDANANAVTAPLIARGRDTGVQLELRAGGPAIGFTPASAQMYLDTSITIGILPTDEQIQAAQDQPVLGVLALFDSDPQLIMWDPATHPEFTTIADIGKTDTTVLYFGGDTYMEYLVGAGILKRSQVDGSFDGSPARFVAEQGAIAQSGFGTDAPYAYEREIDEWGKPVRYQLVRDTGYPNYQEVLSIRSADRESLAPCLARLVPIMQRAQVDFLDDHASVRDLVVQLNTAFRSTTPQSPGLVDFGVSQMRQLSLVSNGTDETIGNFDPARLQRMIDIAGPIFSAAGKPIKDGLQPADISTNEFIDTKIRLP